MKKTSRLFLVCLIMIAGLTFSTASAITMADLAEFQGMIYETYGYAGKEAIVGEDFFLTPHMGHSKTFYQVNIESDLKPMMSNPKTLSKIAAITACEMRFYKANYANGFAEKYFADKSMVADFSKPVFIGLDGNVFSVFITCEDCGCYILYAPLLNKAHMSTVSLENLGQVEETLFKKCTDGYAQLDPALIRETYSMFEENYKKNANSQNLSF